MSPNTVTDLVVGNRFLADLGNLLVELHFETATQLTFTIRDSDGLAEPGYTETVDIHMEQVRPGVYFTSWQEKSGATVTHLEDFVSGRLHSNATLPDGRLFQMHGTLTPLDGSAFLPPDGPERNKQIVLAAMDELFAQGDLTALDRYWREPYVQHSPNLPNGLDTLRAAVPTLRGFSWTPHRIVGENDIVMTHSRVLGWTAEPAIIVDVFRIENDRIVEHWDVIQTEVPAADSVNGNPMI